MIKIKDLKKVYESKGEALEALKNINLNIEKGDIFGIIGLSGAGKSSLLRCINMLEKPTSGKVLIKNIDITSMNPKSLREVRKKIGMIFQHFNLLMHSTVYDNIAFPLKLSGYDKGKIDKRVNELLEVVDLLDKKNVYPAQLSGGQKQRVGIARALANDPEIILSDEATSALDPTTTQSILQLLKEINQKLGITIVVITHEMDVIKNICNKVAVMENGVIVEEGKVIDIFTNPKTNTAKKFLKEENINISKDIGLNNKGVKEKILKISFLGEKAHEPILSNMVKRYHVDANIIAGNIESIQDTYFGNLVVKVSGTEEAVTSSLHYLKENKLIVKAV